MEQTLLTSNQRKVIELVASEKKLNDIYLTGGTALANYYLKHRISDDLDFFTSKEPDTIFLHKFASSLKDALEAQNLRFEKLHDRNQFFLEFEKEELKIEFTLYPFTQLEKPKVEDGIKIDSLRDIAANKMMTILDRFDPKDFVDLYFILQKTDLQKVRQDAEEKFGQKISGLFLGSELAKVQRIEALPKMIKPLTIETLKKFFTEEAKKLAPEIL